MNKREADTILLACNKHKIFLTMHKEGSVYVVNFINRIEIRSFEGAKLLYQINIKTPDKFFIFFRFTSLKILTVANSYAENLKIVNQKNILNLYRSF